MGRALHVIGGFVVAVGVASFFGKHDNPQGALLILPIGMGATAMGVGSLLLRIDRIMRHIGLEVSMPDDSTPRD
jgi:hypothetical protein